jgi:ribonucleotide monophosphatase NagD (HAD superfamily)
MTRRVAGDTRIREEVTMTRTVWRSLVATLVVLFFGAVFTVLAQQGAVTPQQMEMMKKMMMNRPAAMMNADQAIQTQKKTAASEGRYSCCLKQACDHCALKMGECPCATNLQKGMAVCNECKGGWHAGDGAIPGIDPDDVTTMPRMAM